jgi:glucokinase
MLALDFGGTKVAAAIATDDGRDWIAYERRNLPVSARMDEDLTVAVELAHNVLKGHAAKLAAVGVSFGGPVDAASGAVRASHHVPNWEGFPLKGYLESLFGVPARVENDANAGALGEWQFGEGRHAISLLYITVSTGIGAGFVLNGELYRGADGLAGEIGHIPILPNGPICRCGRYGCLEAVASGLAIASDAREKVCKDLNRAELLVSLVNGDIDSITSEVVSLAANSGDRQAQGVLVNAATHLGRGISCAISLLNPDLVVLGGGVTKSGKLYWATLLETARASTLDHITVDIRPSALGDDAPLWGAIALGRSMLGDLMHRYSESKAS